MVFKQGFYFYLSVRSAKLLLELVDGMLNLAKSESTTEQLYITPFNLRHVIDECWSLLSNRAQEKNITFQVKLSERLPEIVEADKQKLSRVLINLLSNSVKFTSNGLIKVIVEMDQNSEIKNMVRFTISDMGIGMSKDFVANLFTPFLQEKSSTSEQGYGLGLAITKNLVKKMGGQLEVESELGVGTTFVVKLPIVNLS